MSGSNVETTRESGEPRHADKPGDTSVWFSWSSSDAGIATFTTRGSGIDTLLGVYESPSGNGSLGALIKVAADNDEGGFFTSSAAFNVEPGVQYKIAVAGFANTQGKIVLDWSFEQSPDDIPQVTEQPDSVTVTEENTQTVTLTAAAATKDGDTSGFTYQCFYHADPVPGATSPTLMIAAAKASDVSSYRLQISKGSRKVRTVPAVLEIGPNPDGRSQDKFDDLFEEPAGGLQQGLGRIRKMSIGAPVSAGALGVQVLGNTGSTKELFEPNHAGVTGGASRWFTLQPDENGTLLIDTLDSEDGSGGLINLNWRLGVAPSITQQPQSLEVRRLNDAALSVAASSDPAPAYQWRKNGEPIPGATSATLNLPDAPLTAAGNYTVEVSNLVGSVVSQVATVTVQDVVHVDLRKNKPVRLPDGRFQFRLILPPNQSLVIEASNDLRSWTPIFTVPADPGGDILFTDDQSAQLGGRFYRTRPAE